MARGTTRRPVGLRLRGDPTCGEGKHRRLRSGPEHRTRPIQPSHAMADSGTAVPVRCHATLVAGSVVLGLPLIAVAGLMCYNLVLYGSPNPAAPYDGPTLLTGNPVAGIVGQIFAQGQGALGTAPFALLAVPGAVALWRRDRTAALKIGLATVPFWLVTLTMVMLRAATA